MNIQNTEVSRIWVGIKVILPICLILIGLAGWFYFQSKKPQMKRKPPKKQEILVETISIKPGDYQSSINVLGTVLPDKEIILKSKVGGEIISVSPQFVQGGIVKKGEILLKIDNSDYKIDILKAQSALDKALSSLEMEKGSQLIAAEELRLINEASNEEILSTDLALRKPQLIQAEASVKSARADLEKAELNLARTKVIAPFNALVLEKLVNEGSLVPTQGSIAILVGIDNYRIEANVPPDRLNHININKDKPVINALVTSQYSDQSWPGKIIQTTGKITEKSRLAGVIILIADPLGLKSNMKKGQLLIDDHVSVKIMGKALKNVFSIPRSILRDDDTLWIYDSGTLDIKTVDIVWKEDKKAYAKSGISQDDKIIISDLPSAIKGMALQIASGDSK